MSVDISIANVGPVVDFECSLAPGVTVLRGKHGAGKTTILRTVQLATDGRTDRKPAKSDGVPRGAATIAGRTLSITKTVRTEGELSVDGLGELSLDVLHTPKFDDPAIRDKHRIATLVRLAGVSADPTLFHPIAGGPDKFAALIDSDSVKTNDLVDMAGRIKRRLERHAQEYEARVETETTRQVAERQAAEGVDLSAQDDMDALTAAMRSAIEAKARIDEQVKAADRALLAVNEAQQRREALPPARDIAALQAVVDRMDQELVSANLAALEARRALQAAEERSRDTLAAFREAKTTLDNARREQALRDELDRTIADHASVDRPSDADVLAAEQAVKAANAASDYGSRVRFAKSALQRADAHVAEAQRASAAAKRLRASAAETQTVLSDAIGRIPNCPLRVVFDSDGDARLVVATDRSEAELFDDLSDGQRWRAVLDIAAAQGKLLVLSQAAWGELSDGTRSQVDAMARERGCYILTAQADDGALRAELWSATATTVAA